VGYRPDLELHLCLLLQAPKYDDIESLRVAELEASELAELEGGIVSKFVQRGHSAINIARVFEY
jgi:hypothetical protein